MLDLLLQAIRSLLGSIDVAIYGVISSVYELMIRIATFEVFKEGAFDKTTNRIYALVGIFMLFKLAFSLIKYIVNPDEMQDQKKGGKKLITNVLMVIVLIIITPTIFTEARRLQTAILQENVIGNLILGIAGDDNEIANQATKDWNLATGEDDDSDSKNEVKPDETTNESQIGHTNPNVSMDTIPDPTDEDLINHTVGDTIASLMFQAFYYPATGSCSSEIEELKNAIATSESETEIQTVNLNDNCIKAFSDKVVAESYVKGMAYSNIETAMFENDVVNDQKWDDNGDKQFSMKYIVLISTIAGIVLLLIFINFCIEVAVRTIKLGFLELIAPIPIISYIDPKSAENGLFSKWLKMCVTTYISLFIRLAAIYFAIFAIGEVTSGGIDLTSSPLVTVFLILGALIFANQLPKMIEELVPSLKGSGTFSLNPMKTIGQSPLASAAVGGLAGAAGGIAANTASRIHNVNKLRNDQYGGSWKKALTGGEGFNAQGIKNMAKGAGSGALSAVGGGLDAGYGAARAGLGGKGSPLGHASQAITRSSQMRNFNAQKGGAVAGLTSRVTDKLTDMAGIKYSSGSTSAIKSEIQMKQHQLQNLQAQEQASRTAVQDSIRTQDMKHQTGLREYFDYAATYDQKGKYTYNDKTYEDYVRNTLIADGYYTEQSWQNLTDTARDYQVKLAERDGMVASRDSYNTIHSAYEMATKADMDSVTLKKEITQLEEQRDIKKTITQNK